MNVCMVGGIFGKPQAYRDKHAITPETVLTENLRARGVTVNTVSHADFIPSDTYDVIHIHHLAAGALSMAAWKGPVPFVFTAHAWMEAEKSVVRQLAHRYILRRCDALVALSQTEARYLAARVGDRIPVAIIPNGIPADQFPAQSRTGSRPDQGRRLLFVGQLTPSKGVDILFKAVQRTLGTRDVELILAYQNSQLEGHYKRVAEKLQIKEKVRFVGFLGVDALSAMYQSADVLILPSYRECLPSVITEALLSGLPVIATDVGGIADQMGPYGRLVPVGDPTELSKAILATLQDGDGGKDLRRERVDYARKTFGVDTMVDSHLTLYRNVINTNKASLGVRSSLAEPLIGALMEVRSWSKRYWSV